jgi:glycosyltransferase involved in cell wall biosynthesis
MASGCSVVCTDAHGNRDFCRDGENCLMPAPDTDSVRAALARLLGDPRLRERLAAAGTATAQQHAWERRIDALEAFLSEIARPSSPGRLARSCRDGASEAAGAAHRSSAM